MVSRSLRPPWPNKSFNRTQGNFQAGKAGLAPCPRRLTQTLVTMDHPKHCAIAKIQEAEFFLELMRQCEKHRKTVTQIAAPEEEFTYFLSAFLNACYSAPQHLHRERSSQKKKVRKFQEKHPKFYEFESGLRSQVAHWQPVKPAMYGYSPPCGSSVDLPLTEKLVPRPGNRVSLELGGDASYYLTTEKGQDSIVSLCEAHLPEVSKFVQNWEDSSD